MEMAKENRKNMKTGGTADENTDTIRHGKYELRPYRPGDESGILNLWKVAFNDHMSLERFTWKYLDNPYEQTMMLCVDDNGEVVTFYGGIPYRFQYRDRQVKGVQLMDIMSHPDHRENKVFAKTAFQFISHFCTPNRLAFMYGFPGAHHFAIGQRLLNYRKTASAAYLTANIPEAVSRLSPDVSAGDMTMRSISEHDLDKFDPGKLWSGLSHAYPFSLIRDARFLQWRFFRHPEKTYRVYTFTNKNTYEISGYAVLSFLPEKAVLVDFAAKDSFGLFQQIMLSLMEMLLEKEIHTLATWLPNNHFLADWSRQSGWHQCDEPTGIIPTVALFDHSPSLDWITPNIYYTMADADLF